MPINHLFYLLTNSSIVQVHAGQVITALLIATYVSGLGEPNKVITERDALSKLIGRQISINVSSIEI